MDDPSPLIRFIPSVSIRSIGDDENEELHLLCYQTALSNSLTPAENYDDTKKKKTPKTEIPQCVLDFCIRFNHVDAANDETKRMISGLMSTDGRYCYSKQVCPFRDNKPKDERFIATIVGSIDEFMRAVLSLWTGRNLHTVEREFKVIGCVIVKSITDALTKDPKDEPYAGTVSKLLTEADAMDIYVSKFSKLSPIDRTNFAKPVVRRMFWHASFLYNQHLRGWDREPEQSIRTIIQEIKGIAASPRSVLFDIAHRSISRPERIGNGIRRLEQHMRQTNDPLIMDIIRSYIEDLRVLPANQKILSASAENDIQRELDQAEIVINFTPLEPPEIVPMQFAAPQQPVPVVSSAVNMRELIDRNLGEIAFTDNLNAMSAQADADVLIESSFRNSVIDAVADENDPLDLVVAEDQNADEYAKKVKRDSKKRNQKRKQAKKTADVESILMDIFERAINMADNKQLAMEISTSLLDDEIALIVHQIAEETVREMKENIAAEARAMVLREIKHKTAPPEYAIELFQHLLPTTASVLDVNECTICQEPLNFRHWSEDVRYLTCCPGLLYVCTGCANKHESAKKKDENHKFHAEEGTVRLTAGILLSLGFK